MQEEKFKAFDYDEIVRMPSHPSDYQPKSQTVQINSIRSYSEDDSSNLIQEKSESIQQGGVELISPSSAVLVQPLNQQDRLLSQEAAFSESEDSNEKISKSAAQSTKSKNDQRRNLYPNVIKSAFKRILKSAKQTSFYRKLEKICSNVDGASVKVQKFKQYCETLSQYKFSLKSIYYYMNYEQGEPQERQMKRVFHKFMLWYLQKRYTIDLIKSKQCECKEEYFRGKNALRYLPSVITKKSKGGQQKYDFIKQ